jgi:UDP-glucose 4-epimerase
MDVMDIEQSIEYLPARNEVKHTYADHSKAKEVFGIDAGGFVSLRVELQRMADWAKKHGARESDAFGNIEIRKNLPDVWVEE